MRNLASIQRISEVYEHQNDDLLELARVQGWQVVVKKGEFQVGDLAIYFEIDSFLPVEDRYEFLRKCCFCNTPNVGSGFRLRTIKIRKELSQGLLLPLSEFKDVVVRSAPTQQNENGRDVVIDGDGTVLEVEEGLDLTDILMVQKFEKSLS